MRIQYLPSQGSRTSSNSTPLCRGQTLGGTGTHDGNLGFEWLNFRYHFTRDCHCKSTTLGKCRTRMSLPWDRCSSPKPPPKLFDLINGDGRGTSLCLRFGTSSTSSESPEIAWQVQGKVDQGFGIDSSSEHLVDGLGLPIGRASTLARTSGVVDLRGETPVAKDRDLDATGQRWCETLGPS